MHSEGGETLIEQETDTRVPLRLDRYWLNHGLHFYAKLWVPRKAHHEVGDPRVTGHGILLTPVVNGLV